MKLLAERELEAFLRSAESDYDVRVPISLHDGTKTLGKLGDGPLALAGGAIPTKITNVFFPQTEVMLTARDEKIELQKAPIKPLLVVGFTAQDADSLEFLDRFYSENYRDDIYFNKRDGAVIVCVSGKCGANGQFLKIAGKKCDMELICDGDKYLVAVYSEAGKTLAKRIRSASNVNERVVEELQSQSDNLPGDDACTACNLVCPTCTCFDVFDRKTDDKIQRWRIWDSCQLDGFMREASGHNPMGTESLRTCRRIHHKLAADVIRWGQLTCMLCGRCDEVCPTGIGIKAVCREMVDKYGSI